MKYLIKKGGHEHGISCDSAATGNYHEGGPADSRMSAHARKRGYNLTSISRQIQTPDDFESFDLIIAMDGQNYQDLLRMNSIEDHASKIVMMTDYCERIHISSVPDPYYGGERGFEEVIDILEDACAGLLKTLINE